MSLSLHDEDEVFVPAEVLVSQHALHTDDTNLTVRGTLPGSFTRSAYIGQLQTFCGSNDLAVSSSMNPEYWGKKFKL